MAVKRLKVVAREERGAMEVVGGRLKLWEVRIWVELVGQSPLVAVLLVFVKMVVELWWEP